MRTTNHVPPAPSEAEDVEDAIVAALLAALREAIRNTEPVRSTEPQHPVEPVVRLAKPVVRWIDWCVLAEASAELLTRPRFPWLRDHARHAYLSPWSRRWWWFAWWLWLAGPAFRLAIRLRIWEVQEGGFYVEGRPRWPWGGR